MNDCCCFQSATGISTSGTNTNVDFTTVIAIIDSNFQIYSNNSNIVSSNISNLYYNNQLTDSNISNLYYNNQLTDSNISNLIYNNDSNISNIYYNTGFIDSNLAWWRYELLGTQAELIVTKANVTGLNTQLNILSTTVSAQGFTIAVHTGQIDELETNVGNLQNNTFTKEQTSNIFVTSNVYEERLSNTSNTLADYNNLYNKPIIFTQQETSNIFITSNVLSNTSNTLADYNNLYNKPDIYTRNEIDTNFYTNIQTNNTFTTLTQSNLLYLNLKNDFSNAISLIDNKWIFNNSNLYVLDYDIAIGKTTPNYKVDINGSLSSTDYRFNDKQLFSLLPTDSPTFNNGISTQISSNLYYVTYTQSDTMILNKPYTVDILLVGAGGKGGLNAFSGGGGAGEVVYISNYSLPAGIYNIDIGIDSSTVGNRITRLKQGLTNLITALGGGNGAGYIETLTDTNTSYFVDTLTTAIINKVFSVALTTNANNNISFTNGLININSTLYYQYIPDISTTPYMWCKLLGNLTDSSGNGYNMGSVGSPTIGTYTVTFASGKYLTFNSSANMSPYTIWNTFGISFSFWFKGSSSSSSANTYLLGIAHDTTQFKYIAIYRENALNSLSFIVYGNPANNYTQYRATANNFFNNTWYHIVWTISSTGAWMIYINGSLVSSTLTCSLPNSTYPIRNLGRSFGSTTGAFVGEMKDIRIYRGVITQTDVTEIYKGRVDIIRNSTSGGSGGGGNDNTLPYLITNSSSSGTPFDVNYSKLTNGYNSIIGEKGGDGGSALLTGRYTDLISGIQVGGGGTGATSNSMPVIKTNYGDGGDGNGGNGRQGVVILKFSGDVITKFLEYTDYNKLFNKPNLISQEQTSNIFVTSNVLSNTSNILANYNNLYNRPTNFQSDWNSTVINIPNSLLNISNIFVTSNVLSNTSNTLANYNNLYNRPIIFTQQETSNIFVTSNVLSNTSNTLANYNNLYNKPTIFTQTETSNIFVTSNVLSNTSNTLANYSNLYNRPINFQSDWNSTVINRPNALTNISNIFVTSNVMNNNFYNKTQIDTEINTDKLLINVPTSTYLNTQFQVNQNLFVYQGDLGEMVRLRTGSSNYVLMEGENNIKINSKNNLNLSTDGNVNIDALNFNANPYIQIFASTTSGTIHLNAKTIRLTGDILTNGSLTRKVPKFFTTSRTASFNGINCLAYDIDLDTNTKKVAINLIEHRKFRIYVIHSNGRLDFQYAPKLFDIHLSTYNTHQAYCIEDRFGVTQLDTVDRTYTFYKNTIDKITFIAPTQFYGSSPITMYYIIEDLLSS